MLDSVTAPSQQPVDFKKIIEENVYPNPNLTEGQQNHFINRYSFAALVLQFIYYFAMNDALLAWSSLICSISLVLIPLLLFFPIFARRRAYQRRRWSGFSEFYHNQKKWDQEALYLTVASSILLLVALWIVGPLILKSAQSLSGSQSDTTNFTRQLQDTVQQYQNLLSL